MEVRTIKTVIERYDNQVLLLTTVDGSMYKSSVKEASGPISDNEALSAHFEYLIKKLKSKIEIDNEESTESKD